MKLAAVGKAIAAAQVAVVGDVQAEGFNGFCFKKAVLNRYVLREKLLVKKELVKLVVCLIDLLLPIDRGSLEELLRQI